MTERPRQALDRSRDHLAIGPSALEWDGDGVTIRIDEITAPLPRRVRGTIRLHAGPVARRRFRLDPNGRHRWWPIAPCARIEVDLDSPALNWSGSGYFDTNDGDAPLERDFVYWDWCRADVEDGAAVLYNTICRDGEVDPIALRFHESGAVDDFTPPPPVTLSPTLWRVARTTRADAGNAVAVRKTLEDTPFYSRSIIDTHVLGAPASAVHESLSLDRFRAPWVQLMLPFKVPRARR